MSGKESSRGLYRDLRDCKCRQPCDAEETETLPAPRNDSPFFVNHFVFLVGTGAPAVIRTRGLRIRSPLLYPAELQARMGFVGWFGHGRPHCRVVR